MSYGDADLDIFFNDMGVSVTNGIDKFKGLLDTPDEVVGSGLSMSTEYLLTVKTESIPSLYEGDTVAIMNINYSVRQIRKMADGGLSQMLLSRVV